MNLHDPRVRKAITTMTPEELRARIAGPTLRKVRAYQGLAVLFLLLPLAGAAFALVEVVYHARAALAGGTPISTGLLGWSLLVVCGGPVLSRAGVRRCLARMTRLIDEDLERALGGSAQEPRSGDRGTSGP